MLHKLPHTPNAPGVKNVPVPPRGKDGPNATNVKPGPHAVEGNTGANTSRPNGKEQAGLKKACQDFESVLLNSMLSKMRESVPKSDTMGSTKTEDTYRGMMDEELSKQMAASGGTGLADMLYRSLSDRVTPAAKGADTTIPKT